MKIELDINLAGKNRIDAYTNEFISIANIKYRSNLIVSADAIIENWITHDSSCLTKQDLNPVISLCPEIVLLGTGSHLHFPPDEVMADFNLRQIGFEVMDTGAACRSYNFLLGEGRQVVAALLMFEAC